MTMEPDMQMLLEEFGALSNYDRKQILRQLSREKRKVFLDALEADGTNHEASDPTKGDDITVSSAFSPWIYALADSDKRASFPALRSDFKLSARALKSLQSALVAGEDKSKTKFEALTLNIDDDAPGQSPDRPSLMSKIGGLISKKLSAQ